MGIAEEIHEHIKKIPLEMASEVLDFIKCLVVCRVQCNCTFANDAIHPPQKLYSLELPNS